ncbi:MAG: hypothetical protein ABI537_13425 [Casimicrobiaceae bacterium]
MRPDSPRSVLAAPRCAWYRYAAGATALAIAVAACSRNEDKPLPADATARTEFVDAQAAKLSESDRRQFARFMARVQAQEKAGGPAPTVSIARALELQGAYDKSVGEAQKRYQEQVASANAEVRVVVREQALVKDDSGKSPSGKVLRYVLDVTNTGKRTIDRLALRVDFRDATGKYQASVPALELKGPLKPGDAGRTTQLLALNPQYQKGILDAGTAQISAAPALIVFADGEKMEPGEQLKALETLSRARIE